MSDRVDGKWNVLIIDDSSFQVKQISKMLEAQNFKVIASASDGLEGLARFQEFGDEIDLITLDITMPGMDGISCLKEIMKINPKANVVMMSALGKEDLVKQSLLIGAKGFIVKPLDAAKVSQVLQSVLKK
ncbi:MAG: response regulator [Spirochaetota bacterium]|nr:response regulator [Spirochaetota bacterium]